MDWAAVAASDYAVPAGVNPLDTLDELLGMLGDPDPVVRDEQARHTLTRWMRAGHFDAKLRELGDQCAVNLHHESVILRSFSAFILAEAFRRDRIGALLKSYVTDIWIECWASWYPKESEIRSYIDGIGWMGTVHHGAYVACQIGLKGTKLSGGLRLMDVLVERVKFLDVYLNQGEAECLAIAVSSIFTDPGIKYEEIDTILFRYPLYYDSDSPGLISPGSDLMIKILQNVHITLRMGVFTGDEAIVIAHPQKFLEIVESRLQSSYSLIGLTVGRL